MTAPSRIRLREFGRLEYGDPNGLLIKLREFETSVGWRETSASVRNLRTNSLKSSRETRDAALFCVGISAAIQRPVWFAPVEAQDYDFVVAWQDEDTQHFCPVQLKEVASHLHPSTGVDDILRSLTKYADSSELVIAIKLNSSLDPCSIHIPSGLSVGGIWFFGSTAPDQSEWAVWGDFAKSSTPEHAISYRYPSAT